MTGLLSCKKKREWEKRGKTVTDGLLSHLVALFSLFTSCTKVLFGFSAVCSTFLGEGGCLGSSSYPGISKLSPVGLDISTIHFAVTYPEHIFTAVAFLPFQLECFSDLVLLCNFVVYIVVLSAFPFALNKYHKLQKILLAERASVVLGLISLLWKVVE